MNAVRRFVLTRDPTQVYIPQAQIFQGGPDGQNGSRSRASVPQPEVAGKAAAGVNMPSSPQSTAKAHARLVIERGKSVGKQFTLSAEESQIGRWDADGGIFPDVDLDSDDPEAKFRDVTRVSS